MSVREKLKEIRLKKGLTLTEVADRSGWGYGTVQGWESGRVEPPLEKLQRLCDLYGISPLDLLDHYPDYDEVQAVLQTPLGERSLEDRIIAAFGDYRVHALDDLIRLRDRLSPEQRASITLQAEQIQEEAELVRRTNLLERYGGMAGSKVVKAVMEAYKDNLYEDDILFAYYSLTDNGKANFLSLLDVVFHEWHQSFVTDAALDYTRARLQEARKAKGW